MNLLTGDPREVAKKMEAYSQQKYYGKLSDMCACIANALNRIADMQWKIEAVYALHQKPKEQPDIQPLLDELADDLATNFPIKARFSDVIDAIRNWRPKQKG
jgi:hypothetical protein